MKPRTALVLFMLTRVSFMAHSSVLQTESTGLKFVMTYRRSAEYIGMDVRAALDAPNPTASAVLVVAGSGLKPMRRSAQQPILSFSPSAATAIPPSVQQVLLATLHQVETLRGVRLYPLVLDILPAGDALHVLPGKQGPAPWAVYDISVGRLLLRQQLVELLSSRPAQAAAVLMNACMASLGHLLLLVKQGPVIPNLTHLSSLLSSSMAAGVAAAFTAATSGPPKWFCFVCPVVLGLLAPLVINAGVGEAADLACKELQLPDDECVDLWFAALAVGMILSLLSAIPIFEVCRLYECAHSGSASTVLTTTS